jgi:hypothetical protein
MAAIENVDPLSADEALRLAEFARACKAAARVVALYPATHPAIQSALTRVADSASRLRAAGTPSLTVLPDGMLLDGRTAAKPDSSIAELATLLHGHLIGEMTLQGDMPPATWRVFLLLLAKSFEEVRAEGGIARAWLNAGGGPLELRQIDYKEVLRERSGGLEGDWDQIIANYLEGESNSLDDAAMAALFEIAEDASRFKDFTERLAAKAAEGGARGKREIVLRVLQALADFVATNHPDQLDRILHEIAGTVPRLSPDLVVTLITTGVPVTAAGARPGIDLPGEVRARISDQTVAEFVANSVSRDHGATERLALAFQALVPEEDRRTQLLEMAQREAANLPIGQQPEFPDLWKSAADLLTSYSDSRFVSEEYGKELSTARTHAIEVERVSDDPPERVSAWIASVSDKAVRRLNHQVLLDLLAIEARADAWQKVLDGALVSVDQLVVSGELDLARGLLEAMLAAAEEGKPFADIARSGLDRLRSGPLMKHVVVFIRTANEDEVKLLSAFCRALGPTVIGPLAEALAVEQGSAVKRLRELVMSFGAAGRAYADELRTSANPAVRRTAIELLRAFGGTDALPDLAGLLDDAEPAVQREALRAIVQIGTDEAYRILEQALKSGTARTRDTMMQVLIATRDERAAPLFVHILEHSGYQGSLESVYTSAIDALGKLGGDDASVAVLKKVLYRGEWWAPGRTSRLRAAAALALRACGSPASQQVLAEAASEGSRGVRRAVRSAMAAPEPRAVARRTV